MKIAPCHPNRLVKAKNLCGACYDRTLKIKNPKYKAAQQSNTTKWKYANPDKMKIITDRRKQKEAADPTFKRRMKNKYLKSEYGITIDEYEKMLTDQNEGCKLCYRKAGKTALHVDHEHETGKVRGLLCHQCNWYMGTIDADLEIINRIQAYIGFDNKGEK